MRIVRDKRLKIPPARAIIWRYMSLDKFLDLVLRHRLFFTNVGQFSDRDEMRIPKVNLRRRLEALRVKGLRGRDLAEAEAVERIRIDPMPGLTLVSTWSMLKEESYALWKIYVGQPAGVAIRTSVGRLLGALRRGGDRYPEDVYLGAVRYAEEIPENRLTRFSMVTTKTPHYEYERELRLFILHFPRSEGGTVPPYDLSVGRYVQVDVASLIARIYVSPFAGGWFEATFRDLMRAVAPRLASRIRTSGVHDR